ncbi:MAG: N-acetylmuramidase family protein [Clostridium sp.]|nr:N-acetylmuramidase family protein [Clostridium sp.]
MKKLAVIFLPIVSLPLIATIAAEPADSVTASVEAVSPRQHAVDSILALDSIEPTIHRLTEQDLREVADELGVEVAAIKAVIDIEAGKSHQGFFAPGQPLVNFDLTMFKRFAARRGITLSKFYKSHPTVFTRPNRQSYQAGQQSRLKAAREIHNHTAIEGTFWGMFQIGGFNWKKCGASSIEEFVERMSLSEREQLELFAQFITNTGLVKHIRDKNWSAFARGYNGASYAKRGYHTRLAQAYRRHKAADGE